MPSTCMSCNVDGVCGHPKGSSNWGVPWLMVCVCVFGGKASGVAGALSKQTDMQHAKRFRAALAPTALLQQLKHR